MAVTDVGDTYFTTIIMRKRMTLRGKPSFLHKPFVYVPITVAIYVEFDVSLKIFRKDTKEYL